MRPVASLECQGVVACCVQVLPAVRGTQRARVLARSKWPSAGDLGGDGRDVEAAWVPDGVRPGALETSAAGQSFS